LQRFVAELSLPVEKTEFEKSWESDVFANPTKPKVDFGFIGRRVSVVIHSEAATQWPSINFYRTFSAAIRRLSPECNIRWL